MPPKKFTVSLTVALPATLLTVGLQYFISRRKLAKASGINPALSLWAVHVLRMARP
jgi:hypothetical protein